MVINFALWVSFHLFAAQSGVAELFRLLTVESEMINPLVEICAGLVLHLFGQAACELVVLEKRRNVSPQQCLRLVCQWPVKSAKFLRGDLSFHMSDRVYETGHLVPILAALVHRLGALANVGRREIYFIRKPESLFRERR
jgi:hypothetical protein